METKISAVIITYNEERNIERCLQSLTGIADEIIVVDSFSTDNTRAICLKFNAHIINSSWLGYGPQKNLGIQSAGFPYILSMDADEELDQELRASIISAKQATLHGIYTFSRLNYYYGKFLRHGLEYPDYKTRLFPKNETTWNNDLVHENLIFTSQQTITKLTGYLLHYTYYTIHEQVHKINHYTTLGTELYWSKGRRASWPIIFFNPLYTFIRAYFIKLGFLDGAHGLIVAILHAYSNFLKYIKLWEMKHNNK